MNNNLRHITAHTRSKRFSEKRKKSFLKIFARINVDYCTIFSSVSTDLLSDISESLTYQDMEFVCYHYQVEPARDYEIDNQETRLENSFNLETTLLQNKTETKRFMKYFYGDPNEVCPIKENFCQHLLQLEPTIVRRFFFKMENGLIIEKFIFSMEKFFIQTNIAIQNFLNCDDVMSAVELILSCYLVEPKLFPTFEGDLVDFISNSSYNLESNSSRKLMCGHIISDETLTGIFRFEKVSRCPYCRQILDPKIPIPADSLILGALVMRHLNN